jgi:tRNA-dihydrouridine synthase B
LTGAVYRPVVLERQGPADQMGGEVIWGDEECDLWNGGGIGDVFQIEFPAEAVGHVDVQGGGVVVSRVLPWFSNNSFPLYLAPMAGVTDVIFRQICKELGADVMVTEFVSAEGIMQADDRTRKYTEFTDEQRPVGVQLFGADGERMGEAAKKIIDWKRPDFIDINFGCPVNKVVARNGGSSLLKDCPVLAAVASGVAKAVGDQVPVTAKIRIGWDENSVNAVEVAKILEDCGMQAIAVHGRTRSQGYGGEANWSVIDAVSRAVKIPVIGNGDIHCGADVLRRRAETAVSGVMIGRAAMQNPWVFREAKHFIETGTLLPEVTVDERWDLVLRHCRMAVESRRNGNEKQTLTAMRSRLMAYCKGFPGAKELRQKLCQVTSISQVEDLAAMSLGLVELAEL